MTAGLEVHHQGQGPGFASDASLRGFSSDHSTDIALWVDGVPINEPVNGHAEGYNDWSTALPRAHSRHRRDPRPDERAVRQLRARRRGERATRSSGSTARRAGCDRRIVRPARGRLSSPASTTTRRGGGVLGVRGVREDGWRPHSRLRPRAGTRPHRAESVSGDDHDRRRRSSCTAPNWDSPGFLSDDQFDAPRLRHRRRIRTDGGFKRRAQERVSLRVLAARTCCGARRSTRRRAAGSCSSRFRRTGGRFEGTGQPDGGGGLARRLRRATRRAHVDARRDRDHGRRRGAVRPRRTTRTGSRERRARTRCRRRWSARGSLGRAVPPIHFDVTIASARRPRRAVRRARHALDARR